MVASNNTISIYNDAWLSQLLLSVWPIFINMDNYSPDLHASDIITKIMDWNVSHLVQLFFTDLIHLILTIPIPVYASHDQLVRGKTKQTILSLEDMTFLSKLASFQGLLHHFIGSGLTTSTSCFYFLIVIGLE